jgi:hypothetical protein
MDDIKLPHEGLQDDDAFFIRPVSDEDDFPESMRGEFSHEDKSGRSEESVTVNVETDEPKPMASDKVAVQFSKFVQLVASHSYVELVDRNADEEVVINSNLLMDLANANDRIQNRRMPLIFLAGIVIGIVLTYIITS